MIVKLTQGKTALVSSEDFDKVSQFKWLYGDKGYAIRREYIKGSGRKNQKQRLIYLHRLIMDFPRQQIDHINGNKLDNRRKNLRLVTAHQQSMNKGLSKNNTSGVKGISWDKKLGKWFAYIFYNYKSIYLGTFTDKNDAILARQKAEKLYFGNFSRGDLF